MVRSAIQTVNPDTTAIWQQAIGAVALPNGKIVTRYNNVWSVPVQVQGLDSGELQAVNYLNIEGVLRKVYITGSLDGVNRAAMKGGDLLIFPDYTPTPLQDSNGQFVFDSNNQVICTYPLRVWKVIQVTERWPSLISAGWTSAIVALQDDPTDFVIDSNGDYVTDSYGTITVAQIGQAAGTGNDLVDSSGNFVLDSSGNRIVTQ